ncbi:hypothetical protein [Streptomyces griseorubiginosus]|uniref:hypothetical protein n=1 Tax=Streptomyces griseorubiginosus TaxID=67304 RepID=UPI00076DD7DE|nr:hypothetical protein [Streptomyces griseorubiginosus]KUM69252.1 hypothetical protein AQI84_34565 [Streptomyces griseorubiginosus]
MADELPGIGPVERSVIVGEGIAQMMSTEGGRELPAGLIGNRLQPPVMNATRDQLIEADRRARSAVAAMDIVLRKWSWGDAKTLGELMPQLPPDIRESVAEHLVRAGLS